MRHGRGRTLMAVMALVTVFIGFPLFAEIVTFTNRDAWTSFIGGQPNYSTDFNLIEVDKSFAETPQIFNALNFNVATGKTDAFPLFKASVLGGPSPSNGNLVDAPPFQPQDTNVSLFNTTHAVLYGDANTTPVWQFLRPVTAFGADFQVIGGQAEILLSQIGGGTVTLAGPSTNGFFGFASDSPLPLFNAINFVFATDGQGSSSFTLAFDNVAGMTATPEPSSLFLIIVIGALVLAFSLGCWLWRHCEPLPEADAGVKSEA
jgi:hypothetical protein